jgi:hypothetical protein
MRNIKAIFLLLFLARKEQRFIQRFSGFSLFSFTKEWYEDEEQHGGTVTGK